MKTVILISFFYFLSLPNFIKSNIELKILDTNIQSGSLVNVEFKNNTKSNFCFVIDTFFYKSKRGYYGGKFLNPQIFLSDLRGNYLPIVREIKDPKRVDDTVSKENKNLSFSKQKDTLVINENEMVAQKVQTLRFFVIKAGKSLKLKIPFSLVVKHSKKKEFEFYDIDRTKKYKGNIEYVINQEFIKINCLKKVIDSVEKKGYKFFTGKLSSNKVPLILK